MAEINENTKILNEISNELKKNNKQTEEIKKDVDSTNDLTVAGEKLEFQKEAQEEFKLSLMKEQNSLLTSILEKFDDSSMSDKTEDKKKLKLGFLAKYLPKSLLALFVGFKALFSKKGLLGIGKKLAKYLPKSLTGLFVGFKTLFSRIFKGIGKFLPKRLLSLFAPIFKTLFSVKGLKGLGKGLAKIIGAPITALFAGIDFFKGWKETKGSVSEKIQGAVSSVLSGLTLGLVKSDVINEGFHDLNSWIFDNVTVPVMDFIENFPERIKEMFVEGIDTGKDLFDSLKNIPIIADVIDKAKEALGYLIQKLDVNMFEPLIKIFKIIETSFVDLKNSINDYIIKPIQEFAEFAVESFKNIIPTIESFGERIKEIALSPLDPAKEFFSDTKDKYNDFKDNFSFKNLFESDKEKKIRKDIEKKTVETLNKPKEVKNNDTTNNNILTNNTKTIINDTIDMSVRSDDLINIGSSYGF